MERIEKLKKFLKDSPQDDFLQHALALEYIKIDKVVQAKLLFEEILLRNAQYLGSYYHLAQLLQRTGKIEEAIATFKKGMEIAKLQKDQHAYNELQMALEDLED